MARSMLADGMAFEKIAKYTELSMEEITVLAEELRKINIKTTLQSERGFFIKKSK